MAVSTARCCIDRNESRPGAIRYESRVHLDPELCAAVEARAAADATTTSEIIPEAAEDV